MKAQSSVYVRLQNIYKAKARQDVAEVLETVRIHPLGKSVDVAEVETFCKNAAFIKLINKTEMIPDRMRELASKEFANDEANADFGPPLSLLPIYLALKATASMNKPTPSQILATIDNLIDGAITNERIVKAAEEVSRAQGGELHNISALTGGMVSQEVIKIITKQYIPIDNTCIFDGITSRTQVLRI
jgi:amyloid beta precursor protein binding protein 1